MHISDGVLSLEVTVVSTIVAFAFFVYSFRSLNNEKIVLASAFSALFFVASFIHIPFGPTQIHLMLLGFIGVFLGSVAIFSISLALILQALLLGFGGVSSIGVNVLIMGLASYLVYIIFKLKSDGNIEKLKEGFVELNILEKGISAEDSKKSLEEIIKIF